ncbi:MmgE/PrpD family protein [Diaphorobacter sp. HDW4A]|nr:MmgE/PrpD family protein [Diaphorobacter sp. HDW4A]
MTAQAGEFIAATPSEAIPAMAHAVARQGIIDCVGVLIAGAQEPGPGIVARLVQDHSGPDAAPLIPSGRRVSALDAALVNGTAAHVLDYDDVGLNAHPSTVLVPALLAQGWSLGSTGRELLDAYVIGYEVWAWLSALEPGALHDRGFHPTAVTGTLAAAAACARLKRLAPREATMALAISTSLASGTVANFGSMTKSFHAGRAAQNGVLSARLAAEGFTATIDALEHRSGWLNAHSPTGRAVLKQDEPELGRIWRLPQTGLHLKRYPVCYGTHRAIDGALDLVARHAIRPEEVASVHVHTGEMQMLMLRNMRPQTGLEAKFSMPFAMAAALIVRRVGLDELKDVFVTRVDVQDLMTKVRCSTTPLRDPTWDVDYAPFDQVTITLNSGQVLEGAKVTRPRGSWQQPMNRDELRTKFMDCAQRQLSEAQASRLFDQLWGLESLGCTRELALLT